MCSDNLCAASECTQAVLQPCIDASCWKHFCMVHDCITDRHATNDILLCMRSATFGGATPQTTAGAAVAAWYGRRHFASEGEGASLRQSADHHLQACAAHECAHERSVYPPLRWCKYVPTLCCARPQLRHLHDAQEVDSEESPGPDSTAINQKSPMSSDKEGNPQVGKV